MSRQFARFVLVGATAATLHWLARYGLSGYLPFGWAVALAYAVGMATAFMLNRVYVFPSSNKPAATQARDFLIINLAFFPIVWSIAIGLDTFLRWTGLFQRTEGIAHALAIPVPTIATFLLYKFLAFKDGVHE